MYINKERTTASRNDRYGILSACTVLISNTSSIPALSTACLHSDLLRASSCALRCEIKAFLQEQQVCCSAKPTQ